MQLRNRRTQNRAFSLIELMIVLIVSAVIVAGIYKFLTKTRRVSTFQKLRTDTESIAQISFFIIGRDIRRAGSNPEGIAGLNGYTSMGADLPIALASTDQIEIKADLNGNGSVESNTDEDITYQWIDDPSNPDGVKDQVRRQSGNQLVIENIRAFALSYQLTGNSGWIASTAATGNIRVVRLYMKVGTGRINPDSGSEDTKEVQMDFMLRNYRS